MFCPNYKNKEIFDGFNEIIEALGGKAMTEEEFRSSELRNQRTGLDYSAMEATYKLYHKNGGNFLDLAPNGKTSILFQTLLSEFGGDRVKAIKAKSAVYSDRFREWFGDWTNKYSNAVLNSEAPNKQLSFSEVYDRVFNKDADSLYTPEEILNNIKPIYQDSSYYNDFDWQTLSKFILDNINNINQDITLQLGSLDYNIKGEYSSITHKIIINKNIDKDGFDVVHTVLHELVHAYTNEFLQDPSNEKILDDLIKLKLYIEDQALDTEYEDLYAFKDVGEFVSEFFTNEDFQEFLMDLSPIDKKQYENLFYQICDFILKLFKSQDTLYDQIRPAMYNILKLGAEKNIIKDNSVSKVVDENGEPLVVYHHTDNSNLTEFSTDFENYFAKDGGTKEAMFFDENKTGTLGRKYDIPVFLNIKDLNEYNETKQQLHDRGTTYRDVVNQSAAKNNRDGGVHMKDFDDNKMEHQSIWIVHNPNQIKSATGNIEIEKPGTGFSTTNNNIYKMESRSIAFLNAENMLSNAAFENILDPNIAASLLDGNLVSSQDVIQSMLNNSAFDKSIEDLANVLQKHDILIKVDNSLGIGTLAATATNKGQSIVLLNADLLKNVSKKYAGITILHEIIHAVTINAIDNPTTKEQKSFVKANKKVLSTLRKAFKGRESLLNNSEYGAYALTNEKEFAAVFITDEQVRNLMYQIAQQMDKNGGIIQILKDFINAVSNLLINRSVFASNEELLTTYHNKFQSFLEGQETQKTDLSLTSSELKALLTQESVKNGVNEQLINATREINEFLDTAEYNKLISIKKAKEVGKFEDITQRLQSRISALRTSTLPLSKKQAAINNTTKILDMYTNEHTPRYSALRATVSNAIPQLLEDLDYLRDLHESGEIMSSSDFMYQKHSNFQAYQRIFNDIRDILDRDSNQENNQVLQIIQEYNQSSKQGSDININDMQELRQDIDNISGAIENALSILNIQSSKIVAQQIKDKSEQSGSIESKEFAAKILNDSKFEDVSWLWSTIGSMDASSNEALRILSSMLQDANEKAHENTTNITIKIVKAAKKLKFGESLDDIYEKDGGKRTGYVVREVNFGKFYKNYDKRMEEINELISKKFGILRNKDDRKAPDSDGTKAVISINGENKNLTATETWNILRNEWLTNNCHRKYKSGYYEAWANVPQCAKDALDDINSQIQTILIQANAIDNEGYRHFEKLSDDQWKEYNKLQIERRYLYSDVDMFGNKKEVGDVSYEIAKALQELNEKLHEGNDKEIKKNTEAWKQARQKLLDDVSSGKKTEDDLHKWDLRNSKLTFRKDEGHDVLKQIEEELDMAKPNYGEEYDKIQEQINELKKPYRLQNGDILSEEMSEAVKNLLINLTAKKFEIAREVESKNDSIKRKRVARKEIRDKYLEYEESEYIKALKKEYSAKFSDEYGNLDENAFYSAMMEFGYFKGSNYFSVVLDDYFELYDWNKTLVAKDKDKYMQYEPGDGWIERDTESKWVNPEFKKYEHYKSTMVPLKEKYYNKQWDKIKKQYDPITGKASGSLGEMYKVTLDVISEANSLQTNRIHHDDYLLPQVMASSVRRLIRSSSGVWRFVIEAIRLFEEKLGIKRDQNSYIDSGIGDKEDFDAEGNYIKSSKNVGSYADGRSYNTIPQYYTKKLDDPSMISTDLVNMLISYYRMSSLYNERNKIKDTCETIVDKLKDIDYIKQSSNGEDFEIIQSDNSRVPKNARTFLDMQLYGQYITRIPFLKKYEVTIALQTLKQYTTAINLGMNPKVAAVGFMTSLWTHLINACTGQKYSKRHLTSGFIEVIYRLGKSLFGLRYINNHKTNDKLMLLMERLNIAGQGERKGEHTNRNILVQGILGNLTFGMLSSADFLSKANILVTTLKAHKYVDGEFLTFDDIERLRAKMSEKEYSAKLSRWNDGASLYSIFDGKNGKLVVREDKHKAEWENAWKKQSNFIMSRVEKYAEDADGMTTQLQKALMTQNIVGMLFLIHRQFLGLMLQQRWGERVYDYDTKQYKNGIFRTAFKYGAEVIKNSLFGSGIAGAVAGLAILGTGQLGAILGVTSHVIYRATHKGKNKKSISEINKEFFGMENFNMQMLKTLLPFGFKPKYNNPLDEKTYLNQRQNFYDIKRIMCEVLIYNLILQPFANYIAMLADNDDDDKFMLQMFAYWMRAFQWEAYTPYRPAEVLGAIKSATAVTSPVDKTQNVINSVLSSFVPFWSMNLIVPSIFETGKAAKDVIAGEIDTDYYDEEITRGAYSYNEFAELFNDENRGWTRREQAFFKLLPFHNLYEQIKDSKSKRRYIENQIMHLKQEGSSGNYLWDFIDPEGQTTTLIK